MSHFKKLSALLLSLTITFALGCAKSNTKSKQKDKGESQADSGKEPGKNSGDEVGKDSGSIASAQYIVVYKKSHIDLSLKNIQDIKPLEVVKSISQSLIKKYDLMIPKRIFSYALQGAVYKLNDKQLDDLRHDPSVAYIEKDQIISINSSQVGPTWGIDRIDQQNLPLDHKYNFDVTGVPVNVYVVDTGILVSHQEFQGRASSGIDFVDKDSDATDCNGHGTHVAGTIASATYGVAKNAKLIGVRVLNCNGSGRNSDVIAGIEWVTQHHRKPAVANMSLGGGVSVALDDAVKAAVKAGVTFVVAAGNENVSACNGSPSRVPVAITVGSTTNKDVRSSFSNYGPCVDIFAPGSDITSTWFTSNVATNTISGTSMASPHVAGVAALYLSQHPDAIPSEVASALVAGSLSGKVISAGSGSPNKLLNTLFVLDNNLPTDPAVPIDPIDPPKPCTVCTLYKGEITQSGSTQEKSYTSAKGLQQVWLEGPSNTDFDIYLYKSKNGVLSEVARAIGRTASEQISYQGLAGDYVIRIKSYSGVGKYNLWYKKP